MLAFLCIHFNDCDAAIRWFNFKLLLKHLDVNEMHHFDNIRALWSFHNLIAVCKKGSIKAKSSNVKNVV